MSISTGAGDDGNTGLTGAFSRLSKDHPRIECLGVLDELNAFIGDARCTAAEGRTGNILEAVQRDLFVIAGALAGSGSAPPGPERLNVWVREIEAGVPYRGFVIPGANSPSARLHIARTVCRRAERRLAALARLEAESGSADAARFPPAAKFIPYMNRLSDLLFLLACLEG
ncbi:MAG: cob(I)yrinic acid a,c-diamide adenosyltransferase [Treponema sp.]|jgi:cob(I)alamin adenosyltransferase|nr:cob(I)yrinic acid a,c-diamide adenosyltransferase [Treponema sp.]